MIYSATIFNNEFDLLDLKIKEETPYVDKLYVVEGALYHQGGRKPQLYPKNKYKDNPKVHYIYLDEKAFSKCERPWDREAIMRDIIQDIVEYNDDDVWLVSDMDEIICGDKIPLIAEEVRIQINGYVCVCPVLYYYYINTQYPRSMSYGNPISAVMGNTARLFTFTHLRTRKTGLAAKRVYGCSHHFSYLMTPELISQKLRNTAHVEYSGPKYSDIYRVKDRISRLEDVCGRGGRMTVVEIDDTYPKTILNNLKDWDKYIYKVPVNA
jgi:beta-1,4-mannosyl-glycoprotein beta-1,4-N-acetylglucosaminyltransferase